MNDCGCVPPQKLKEIKSDYKDSITVCIQNSMDQPIIPHSCITKDSLMRIIRSWNRSYSDQKIVIGDKTANDLYLELDEKMRIVFKCESKDEVCWLKSISNKDDGLTRLLKLYRPITPVSFRENNTTPWSTSQIYGVLDKYTFAYPFYWCGVVPLDFKERRDIDVCLTREACSVNLRHLWEKGCRLVAAIFNLDYSFQGGSHWTAGLVDLRHGEVSFFDSYGYPALKPIQLWLDNCRKTLNEMAMEGVWSPIQDKHLVLCKEQLKWQNGRTFVIEKEVPNHLIVQQDMVMKSSVSDKIYRIKQQDGRKKFVLDKNVTKREREGTFTVFGARQFYLHRRVQKSGTECGTFCIHVIISALVDGKSWHQIIKTMPSDYIIKKLRMKYFRDADSYKG